MSKPFKTKTDKLIERLIQSSRDHLRYSHYECLCPALGVQFECRYHKSKDRLQKSTEALRKHIEALNSTNVSSFAEYEETARSFLYGRLQEGPEAQMIGALGLCSESGEYAQIIRDEQTGKIQADEASLFEKKIELGDALWYVMRNCWAIGSNLKEIANMNIKKLKDRKSLKDKQKEDVK